MYYCKSCRKCLHTDCFSQCCMCCDQTDACDMCMSSKLIVKFDALKPFAAELDINPFDDDGKVDEYHINHEVQRFRLGITMCKMCQKENKIKKCQRITD